jgi:SAM-dependent methyltransferase
MRVTNHIIPFYAADHPRMFEIERRCMDRDQIVTGYCDAILPSGQVLDIGAGNGFMASMLTRGSRLVVPLEPVAGMMDRGRDLPWVAGVAQQLPFRSGAFNASYATWAYFFPSIGHGDEGLTEAHRVVIPGGPIVVVDNAGGDEFCALSPTDLASDPAWWSARGFDCEILRTAFKFDSVEEAQELLLFYFGERGRRGAKREIGYNVAVYVGKSRGPSDFDTRTSATGSFWGPTT